MSAKFDPAELLKEIAPKSKIEKLLKLKDGKIAIKKSALSFVDDIEYLDKKQVLDVALKVATNYRKRVRGAEPGDKRETKSEILDDPKLLIQRVQNDVVFQVHEKIKENYGGQKARWLPSSSLEPRATHALNYGKIYTIGEGLPGDDGSLVEPGDEPGCQCGVEILDESELNLE